MNRRSILLGMGTAAAGAGAVFGSGAFTQVQTERDLTIGVDEDSSALLELNASGDVASVANGENGELVIDTDRLSSESESNSQGFAVGSTVEIGEIDGSDNVPSDGAAFTLTNNFDDVGDGNANLDVGIDLTNIDLSTVSGLTSLEFYGTPSNGNGTQVTSAGGRSVFDVASGEKIYFAIKFTTASTTGPTGLDDATVAFQAGSDLTSGDFPTPQPVVRSSDEFSFTSIQAAIDDTNTNSGETLTVAGTFNESVTIDVDDLTLEAAEDASPTIRPGGSVDAIIVSANNVTVDGLTLEASGDTTAVDIDGVSDSAAVTLTNNVIDLTGGADSVGIVTGSGSGISETIADNTFQADADNFLGDTTIQPFINDENNRVDFGTIESENTFEPGVTTSDEFGSRLVSAAVPVDSDDEFLQALADDRDAPDEFLGGPLALSESYTDGLDSKSIIGQRDFKSTVRVDIDPADINTSNSYTTPDGEAISGAYIREFDLVEFPNVTLSGGDVFIFVPDFLKGEEVTIAVGNFDQISNPSGWDSLSGDDIVIQNVTIQ